MRLRVLALGGRKPQKNDIGYLAIKGVCFYLSVIDLYYLSAVTESLAGLRHINVLRRDRNMPLLDFFAICGWWTLNLYHACAYLENCSTAFVCKKISSESMQIPTIGFFEHSYEAKSAYSSATTRHNNIS